MTPLAEALKQSGKSDAALAAHLGVPRQYVGRWKLGKAAKNGADFPREHAPAAAAFLGVRPEFLLLGEALASAPAAPTGYRVEPNAIPEPGPVYLPLRGLLPRDVPEMGATVGGFGKDDTAFEMNGEIVDMAPRPPGIAHRKNVFCLRVSNDSMEPRYEDGDRIYVEKRKPAIRDYVVIELKPTSDGAPLKSFIKRLVAITPQLVTVEQFNPRGLLEFEQREINQMLRVIPDPELRGE